MVLKGIHKDYFTLPELSAYSGLGIRFLRDAIKDSERPLPHFRLNNKTILVSRLEFADWLEKFRASDNYRLHQIVDQVMNGLSKKPNPGGGRPSGAKEVNGEK
jgi:hypothetical protein